MLVKVIFAIVWILELVWNWLREEWAKVNSNMEEKSGSEERVMERVEGRKRKERRTKNGKRHVVRKKEE